MQEEADRRRKEKQKKKEQTEEGFLLLSQHCYHTSTVLTAVTQKRLQHDTAPWQAGYYSYSRRVETWGQHG